MIFKANPDNFMDMATIEHLEPISNGGTNDLSNLRLAHKRCNR
ncbi:HNH endonuclease [uncultured Paraglaciecola sp.]